MPIFCSDFFFPQSHKCSIHWWVLAAAWYICALHKLCRRRKSEPSLDLFCHCEIWWTAMTAMKELWLACLLPQWLTWILGWRDLLQHKSALVIRQMQASCLTQRSENTCCDIWPSMFSEPNKRPNADPVSSFSCRLTVKAGHQLKVFSTQNKIWA